MRQGAPYESPRLSATSGDQNQVDDDGGEDPRESLMRIVEGWIEAEKAERAARAIDVTPTAEPTKDQIQYAREIAEEERKTWKPDDEGIDGEMA